MEYLHYRHVGQRVCKKSSWEAVMKSTNWLVYVDSLCRWTGSLLLVGLIYFRYISKSQEGR